MMSVLFLMCSGMETVRAKDIMMSKFVSLKGSPKNEVENVPETAEVFTQKYFPTSRSFSQGKFISGKTSICTKNYKLPLLLIDFRD